MAHGADDRNRQIITGKNSEPLYVLVSVAEFDDLQEAAQRAEDVRACAQALDPRAGEGDFVPADVVHRICDGVHPVRVWREYRGMKAIDLARAAGISAPYLSEIETGKKDGTFKTMAAIAGCLDVTLDDLAPAPDEDAREEREMVGRVARIKVQIRQIEALIVGSTDFDTGAVRAAALQLIADAHSLLADAYNPGGWLDEVVRGAEEILELVNKAEGDIIQTAKMTRLDLEKVVSLDRFRQPRVIGASTGASTGAPAAESKANDGEAGDGEAGGGEEGGGEAAGGKTVAEMPAASANLSAAQ